MKIAILSDIHEGLNRKQTASNIMDILKRWLKVNSPDLFIVGGDMTAGAYKSLDRLNELQNHVPNTKILFVHGNHDVYHEDSKLASEILLQFPGNIGNGPIEIGTDWVVIGDGGWYDYTFGIPSINEEEFSIGMHNGFTWPDKSYAHWPHSDVDMTSHYVAKLEDQLRQYTNKKIIFVTHFVPFKKFVKYKGELSWDFFNAMMGSTRFGELAVKYHVKKYIFGHIHTRYHETYEGIEVICNPLGYYPHEWNHLSAEEEIFSTIKVIEI
jgi:putative phosphoesterase